MRSSAFEGLAEWLGRSGQCLPAHEIDEIDDVGRLAPTIATSEAIGGGIAIGSTLRLVRDQRPDPARTLCGPFSVFRAGRSDVHEAHAATMMCAVGARHPLRRLCAAPGSGLEVAWTR